MQIEGNCTAPGCSICRHVLFAVLVAAAAGIDRRIAMIVAGTDCIAELPAADSASGIVWDQWKSAEAHKGL